ncbi:MAG TPA: DUF6443 domain-containing protein, partial [Chitinophagaceae bacterium]|nr:DUF6443 domain-containing protein [Chitinophagaceae bacterium]
MRTIHLILFCLVMASTAQLQSQTPYLPASYSSGVKVSYVRTWDALKPENNTNNITTASAVKDFRMTTQYVDGLGRSLQTVTKQGSLATGGTAADLVVAQVYDELGREVYKFLPSPANSTGSNASINDGLFKLNPFAQQAAFYGNSFSNSPVAGQDQTYYYSKTQYEASPLNRVTETFAPGNSWVGTADAVETSHRSNKILNAFNTAIDSVRIWTVNSGAVGSWATFTSSAAYEPGQLYKTITTDEQGKEVIEFKDKQGQVILKKVQIGTSTDDGSGRGHTGWLCTYYMYDDLGRLRCVLQPQGVKNISSNWVL